MPPALPSAEAMGLSRRKRPIRANSPLHPQHHLWKPKIVQQVSARRITPQVILDKTGQITQENVKISIGQKAPEHPNHLAVTDIFAGANMSAKIAKLDENLQRDARIVNTEIPGDLLSFLPVLYAIILHTKSFSSVFIKLKECWMLPNVKTFGSVALLALRANLAAFALDALRPLLAASPLSPLATTALVVPFLSVMVMVAPPSVTTTVATDENPSTLSSPSAPSKSSLSATARVAIPAAVLAAVAAAVAASTASVVTSVACSYALIASTNGLNPSSRS